MKKQETRKTKKNNWSKYIGFLLVLPIILLLTVLIGIYTKQDEIIQSEITSINKGHKGKISISDTHIDPFKNFPYISVKIDSVKVLESKAENAKIILDVADIYIGFNLWDIIQGNYDIKKLLIEDGFFNFILHQDGKTNIQNALATSEEGTQEDPMNIHLKNIELQNLDIHKLDEETMVDVETYIYSAYGGFKTGNNIINAHIDTEFELNIIDNGDTTYVNHKHFEFHTDIQFHEKTGLLNIQPSGIRMEHGDFNIEGSVDTKNDVTLDLKVTGQKPNFDMLIAFAPQDLIPVLERYKNEGNIYFNAVIQGPTLHGQMPFFDATFGANKAFLENIDENKKIEDIGFRGHFTNGEERDLKTMEFSLTGMEAKLETGNFVGSVLMKNFEKPEIEMQLDADVDLEFLARFLNLKDVKVDGNAGLKMRFHDIVDLDQPELALNNLNQAYFSELKIENLSLESEDLPTPLKKLNLHLLMNGKKANLDLFDIEFGESDMTLSGYISDLPAIIHHSDAPIDVHLDIHSKVLDIAEITNYSEKDSTGVDERIEDLMLGLSFQSSARALTESENLPVGEFFVDSFHAQLKHYPHELHDFHIDILIDDNDLKIKDFKGFLDQSDFHLNGMAHNYAFWMKDTLNGDVDLDLTLNADLLRLEDIFSYGGENYVPEDYRHEEIEDLIFHLNTSMHYKESSLHSIDIKLDKFQTKMHIHPMKFKNFKGNFHYEDDHLMVKDFHGEIGRTIFDINANYYLGNNPEIRKRDNHFGIKANYIDFDQLFAFNLDAPQQDTAKKEKVTPTKSDVSEHSEAFNLYELPFTEMTLDADIGHFVYHRIDLQKIHSRLRTTKDHYIYVDTLDLNAAGGNVRMSGYFNGSDPKHVYLKPNLHFKNVDLDKLLFKFENFGQDAIVSENLHGKLTADITGKIRMYPDMVSDIDQSEIHMDVLVLDGKLENYEYMLMLSDYFGDKDLSSVRFDTLQNHMDITNGLLTIPNMNIESTLGHFEISGTQDMDLNMEYYVRIPWKVIKQGAKYKLFGKKKNGEVNVEEDEIVKVDSSKKTRFLNLKIHGNMDDYKITLGKDKTQK